MLRPQTGAAALTQAKDAARCDSFLRTLLACACTAQLSRTQIENADALLLACSLSEKPAAQQLGVVRVRNDREKIERHS